jgi:hypothetical protein
MELLYNAIPHGDHEWLTEGKRAVVITTAPHTDKVVCIMLTQKNADLNGDGVPDQLNIKIRSELVELETGVCVCVNETPIGTTSNVHSMDLDGITSGEIDVNNWIAELINNSIYKCLRHEAALKAFSLIPIA